MSSIVTSPAVPPYSSSTIAMCTCREAHLLQQLLHALRLRARTVASAEAPRWAGVRSCGRGTGAGPSCRERRRCRPAFRGTPADARARAPACAATASATGAVDRAALTISVRGVMTCSASISCRSITPSIIAFSAASIVPSASPSSIGREDLVLEFLARVLFAAPSRGTGSSRRAVQSRTTGSP